MGRQPEPDRENVGIGFVDVLFALVVGQVLLPFAGSNRIPLTGVTQLVLAGVVTLASWIGYHYSKDRPRYKVGFPNWPLAQLLIDVSLVILYWLLAASAEGVGSRLGTVRSARWEAVLVAASFALYAMWDLVALAMRKNSRYTDLPIEEDVPGRRRVTFAFAFMFAAIAVVVWIVDPKTSRAVIKADLTLLALAVAYRFVQYRVPDAKLEA